MWFQTIMVKSMVLMILMILQSAFCFNSKTLILNKWHNKRTFHLNGHIVLFTGKGNA